MTILGNLLHNAVEAVEPMPPSRRRVSVALLQRRDETVFRVRDWAPAWRPEDVPRLFDREYTTRRGTPAWGCTSSRAWSTAPAARSRSSPSVPPASRSWSATDRERVDGTCFGERAGRRGLARPHRRGRATSSPRSTGGWSRPRPGSARWTRPTARPPTARSRLRPDLAIVDLSMPGADGPALPAPRAAGERAARGHRGHGVARRRPPSARRCTSASSTTWSSRSRRSACSARSAPSPGAPRAAAGPSSARTRSTS